MKLTVLHARRGPAGEQMQYELDAEEALQVADIGLEAFWWRKLSGMRPDELREFLGYKPGRRGYSDPDETIIERTLEVLTW